jgi:hypothetical protein
MKRLIYCHVICLSVVLAASACFAGGSFTIRWGDQDRQANSQAYKKKGGPPPHAPAHGYRAKYNYRYYPGCRVYHCAQRGLYFWLRGDNWEVGASLPSNLQASLGDFVGLELDTDKPYRDHAEHARKYPPGQFKKKAK